MDYIYRLIAPWQHMSSGYVHSVDSLLLKHVSSLISAVVVQSFRLKDRPVAVSTSVIMVLEYGCYPNMVVVLVLTSLTTENAMFSIHSTLQAAGFNTDTYNPVLEIAASLRCYNIIEIHECNTEMP